MLRACAVMLLMLLARISGAEVELPVGDPREDVSIYGRRAHQWRQGSYEVWLLEGACRIQQGAVEARSENAVLWIDRTQVAQQVPAKIICYLEGKVQIDLGHQRSAHQATGRSAQTLVDENWLGRFYTLGDIEMNVPVTAGQPQEQSALFLRGMQSREPANVQTAFQEPIANGPAARARRIRVLQRSNGSNLITQNINNPLTNETIYVATGGVRVIVEGVLVEGVRDLGTLDLGKVELEADNVIVWHANLANMDVFGDSPAQSQPSAEDAPIEIYMEGNIIFRQGRRVIYANRMYYDVQQRRGVVLQAEILTPVMDYEYEGLVRLKADVLHQLDQHNFAAYGAAITSSRIGYPRYWLQSEMITFQDEQRARVNPLNGFVEQDPITGEADTESELLATSRNNFLYVAGVPVFYWPVMATDLRKPTFYIDSLRVKNDSVFGFQVLTDLDAFQILGIGKPPEGVDWTISTDYLSDRGPALGTNVLYDRPDFFGHPTPIRGLFDAWGIRDTGLDNLGADRRALTPEEEFRGRVLWQHRQYFSNGLRVTGELGLISDRNFLEQYFEQEWDTWKDQTTGVELKWLYDNQSFNLTSDVRLNDFFTQTEWLPRFDHFLIGQSLLGDWLTWHAHSQIGYGHLRTAEPAENPIDAAKFDPLAWEVDREGIRAVTRQEIDVPLNLGPTKVVPYVLGEAAHWGEVIDGSEASRLFGQAGIRSSLPFASLNRELRSELFNLNGLAHKVSLESDLYMADASEDLAEFPLYDPLDDDATEFFRRRFLFDTFGGMAGDDVPLQFDERYFALRSGLQSWVSSPATEIADDLVAARLAIRQRLQTKRGLPGRERIIDWMVLDLEGTVFPKADRDNFGEEVGLLNYDFRWHVGDRFTVLSDGFADLFPEGLKTYSVGSVVSRPGRGRIYLAYRAIDGPITSDVITGAVTYRMTEKWIATAGATFDLGPTGNIGQSFAITRVGESALVRFGLNVDESRNNVGVNFAIEPRFLPRRRLGEVGGVFIPPAGALGLE